MIVQGYSLDKGELKDNKSKNLFSAISHSLFSGTHATTYKYCFFKSLLDNLFAADENYVIPLKAIGSTFAGVYWNMVNIYNIPQKPRGAKNIEPFVELLARDVIKKRPYLEGVRFESMKDEDRDYYTSRSYREFLKYVVGAFYSDTYGLIYGFSKKDGTLWLNEKSFSFLADNKVMLDQVNYYEWLKMCEVILDSCKRMIGNLSTVLEDITKRADLTIFKDELNSLSKTETCFYCGKKLTGAAHLDHVIPWSFIKKDQLWNFVFACPSCNESKNDKMPTKEFIDKLIKRNADLGIESPNIKQLASVAYLNGVKSAGNQSCSETSN